MIKKIISALLFLQIFTQKIDATLFSGITYTADAQTHQAFRDQRDKNSDIKSCITNIRKKYEYENERIFWSWISLNRKDAQDFYSQMFENPEIVAAIQACREKHKGNASL